MSISALNTLVLGVSLFSHYRPHFCKGDVTYWAQGPSTNTAVADVADGNPSSVLGITMARCPSALLVMSRPLLKVWGPTKPPPTIPHIRNLFLKKTMKFIFVHLPFRKFGPFGPEFWPLSGSRIMVLHAGLSEVPHNTCLRFLVEVSFSYAEH